MATTTLPDPSSPDASWTATQRWSEYAGEQRANILRMAGIIAFYSVELINRHGLRLGFFEFPAVESVDDRFHRAITGVAVAWTMLSMAVLIALRAGFFPRWFKYATTALDIVLLTLVLLIGDGPRSPLVAGYFLLIAMSALRFDLWLIRCAAIGSAVGYLVLNGYARWFASDAAAEMRSPTIGVPRYHQLIVLLAIGLCGIVLGQVVRRMHGMAREYARRVEERSGSTRKPATGA